MTTATQRRALMVARSQGHFLAPEGEPRIYRTIRFHFSGRPRTLRNNLTKTEAIAHCNRPDTSSHSTGPGAWFDGWDYMRGCRPKGE